MMINKKEKDAIDTSKLDEILPKYDPLKLNGINLAQNYVSAFNTGMNIYQCVNQLQGYIEWVVKDVNDVVKLWNVQVGESIDQSKAIVRETTTEQFNTEWTNKQPELIEQVNTLTTNQFNEDWGVLENRINTTLETQNTKINSIQTQQTNLSNQQTTLSNRMDTFTSLSEGSTTGDAELKDIRVGANGITYNNAGDAVRGQYSQLKEDIDNAGIIKKYDNSILINGGYIDKNGNLTIGSSFPNLYYTDYIDVGIATKLIVYTSLRYCYIAWYDKDKKFITETIGDKYNGYGGEYELIPPENAKFIRLSCSNDQDSSGTYNKFSAEFCYDVYDTLHKNVEKTNENFNEIEKIKEKVDGKISPEMTTFIVPKTLNLNGNLIFESEIEIGAFLDGSDGSKLVNQHTHSYCTTPFIEIEPNISYFNECFSENGVITGAYSTCFYDADKVFISSLNKYVRLFTTPDNAKYIRLCWSDYNDMVGTGAFLLKKSTEIVTVYEAPSYTPTLLVDSDYVTKEVTDNLDERVTVLEGSSNKQYINLASDYYITNGDTLELFYRGLLNLGDYKKYNIKIECSVGGYFEKRYIFTPTSSNVGDDYPLTLSLYDDNDKLIESATTTIHCIEKKSNPSNQVNVLCVGDSLTAGGQWVTELRRLLIEKDGLANVRFIGTCGTSPNKYEGYGGWSIASYNSSMATNAYMWVNVSSHDKTSADQHSVYVDSNGAKWKIETIETNRLKMIRTSGSSAIPTSGSLTWESGGDNHSDIVYSSVEQASGNPFWNESTNKNDFVAYANQQGVSNIDYCLILIGWNQSDLNESITKSETNRFINSLQTDFPNCKIILAGLQIPSLDGCGNNYGCTWYWKEKVNFVFNLQKWYEDIASSNDNVIFTQVSGQFDSENNMPLYQRTVNKRNSNKEYFGGNGVHPADSGYLQIADVFYRAFESF